MNIRRIVPLSLVAVLAGCLNTEPVTYNPRYFVLDATPPASEAKQAQPSHVVGLMPITLPAYVDTDRITLRKSDNEVTYLNDDRWGGQLDDGLADFLKLQIEGDLAGVLILPAPWNHGDVDFVLKILYSRCEIQTDGTAVVEASWGCSELANPSTRLTGQALIRKSGPSPSDSIAGSVTTLSQANSELATEISRTIEACIAASGKSGN